MSKRRKTPNVMDDLQGLAPKEDIKQIPSQRPITSLAPPKRQSNQPSPRKQKRSTPKSRLIKRVTYEIGPELKKTIYEESLELGVPASQLAKYLLLYAWDFYAKGTIPPPELSKSNSPKYRNNIYFG